MPGKCGNNRWKHGESGLCISIAFTSRRQPDAAEIPPIHKETEVPSGWNRTYLPKQ